MLGLTVLPAGARAEVEVEAKVGSIDAPSVSAALVRVATRFALTAAECFVRDDAEVKRSEDIFENLEDRIAARSGSVRLVDRLIGFVVPRKALEPVRCPVLEGV